MLVHGDLGLHNIAIDPTHDTVTGVFDYADASWSDRHQNFRNLVFPGDADEQAMLESALEVYETALALTLDRHLIHLCNAACAVGFLAYRQSTPPEMTSCGRTLVQDLAWVRSSLELVGSI